MRGIRADEDWVVVVHGGGEELLDADGELFAGFAGAFAEEGKDGFAFILPFFGEVYFAFWDGGEEVISGKTGMSGRGRFGGGHGAEVLADFFRQSREAKIFMERSAFSLTGSWRTLQSTWLRSPSSMGAELLKIMRSRRRRWALAAGELEVEIEVCETLAEIVGVGEGGRGRDPIESLNEVERSSADMGAARAIDAGGLQICGLAQRPMRRVRRSGVCWMRRASRRAVTRSCRARPAKSPRAARRLAAERVGRTAWGPELRRWRR